MKYIKTMWDNRPKYKRQLGLIGLFFLVGCSNAPKYSASVIEDYQPSFQASEYDQSTVFYNWQFSEMEPLSRLRVSFKDSSFSATTVFPDSSNVLSVGVEEDGKIYLFIEGTNEKGGSLGGLGSSFTETAKPGWTYIEPHTTEQIQFNQEFPLLTFHYNHSQDEQCKEDCMVFQGELLEEDPQYSEINAWQFR